MQCWVCFWWTTLWISHMCYIHPLLLEPPSLPLESRKMILMNIFAGQKWRCKHKVHTGEWNERVALIYIHYLVWNSQLWEVAVRHRELSSALCLQFWRILLTDIRTPFYGILFHHFEYSLPSSHLCFGQISYWFSVQFSSVQSLSRVWLMDCSTPGLPVHHQLLDSTQTHVVELARR